GLGFRHHRNQKIVIAGAVGMLTLVIGATVAHTQLGLTADRVFTIMGALVLAAAHFFNSLRTREHRSAALKSR
ncbi:MAG: MerC domain-containing protein, partial [Gammaproteobacteria bacterium]|nr:MerC domain-containing protein [Gammaproteobacteria bacterium]